ncbi:ADP-ribosylation factor 6-like [Anopheles ziemanni]|uniref:ADP-ribosylation factor 6-like n=1 Tax=Anopheles coustani TaxID=139045 RepID=UPI00265A7C75|nr:ADP-ribosylation factor 6-like [Anopheles coustani]XP_058178432.1 ADP-ribosylation factor 6-like [Anopheles ziemanni]
MGKCVSKIFFRKELGILMLGLDAAGKTTILYKLKLAQTIIAAPTVGFNVDTVTYKNVKLNIWDVGGDADTRPLWKHYCSDMHGLIFVVDCADANRIHEARQEFHRIINDSEMQKAIILIFANKQDLPNAIKPHEIHEKLGLTILSDRNYYIQPCCATTGDGLDEGLKWLIRLNSYRQTSVWFVCHSAFGVRVESLTDRPSPTFRNILTRSLLSSSVVQFRRDRSVGWKLKLVEFLH